MNCVPHCTCTSCREEMDDLMWSRVRVTYEEMARSARLSAAEMRARVADLERSAEVDRLLRGEPVAPEVAWTRIPEGAVSSVALSGKTVVLDEEPEFPPYFDLDALCRFTLDELVARLDASLFEDAREVFRAVDRFLAVEEKLAADGYVFVDGTWRKPPAWDPLGTAVALWDVLPELPENLPATSENLRVGLVSRVADTGLQNLRELSVGAARPIAATQLAAARAWEWSGETVARRALPTALAAQWAITLGIFAITGASLSWLFWQAVVSVVIVAFVAGRAGLRARRDSRPLCRDCSRPTKGRGFLRCPRCSSRVMLERAGNHCSACRVPIGPAATWCSACESVRDIPVAW